MADATLFDEVPWEYTVAYVDKFSGRHSVERPRYDGRSLEVAEEDLRARQQGNPLWSESVIIRRRRGEWERVDGNGLVRDGLPLSIHSDPPKEDS